MQSKKLQQLPPYLFAELDAKKKAVAAKGVDKIGMVEDFSVLKMRLNRILRELDHKHLNAIPYFTKVNPTSENIAKYIFDKLRPQNPKLKAVTVWESEGSSATYAR